MAESNTRYWRKISKEQNDEAMVSEFKVARQVEDLEVFQKAFEMAAKIFELSKGFPKSETYALTDQIRRSSRAVAALIGEAWPRRKYPAAFVNKLNEAEAEAGETRVWLQFALSCDYASREEIEILRQGYEQVLKTLAAMGKHSESWTKGIARPNARN